MDTQPLRTILVHIAVIVVFGVFLPWWLGFQFLDPVTIAAYSCLGVMFSAPAAAQAFVGEVPTSMSDVISRILISVLYGELMAISILIAGFLTMFATRSRALIVFDPVSMAEAVGLGIAGSLAFASIAAIIGLQLSKSASRMALRFIFLGLLLLFFFRSRWLPDVEITGAAVCLGITAIALGILSQLIHPPPAQ